MHSDSQRVETVNAHISEAYPPVMSTQAPAPRSPTLAARRGDDDGRPRESTPEHFAPFAVDHILVDQLPASLGTVNAPERYVVTAMFTRRPLRQELDLLTAPAVEERLAVAGYTHTALSTSDRRLVIANTNLRELKHGLAHLIGQILDDIGTQVATTRSAQARDAAEVASRAAARSNQVIDEAAQINFSVHVSHYT